MKKLALIIGAIAASALLAGGVVATYIITDNANKQGIHITPNIVNDRTGTVTLSWGDNAGFTDIEGLRAGTPITRSVIVKAETRNEEDAIQNDAVYEGSLEVELRDLSGKTELAKKLIDYLSVEVKAYTYADSAFAAEKSTIATLTKAGGLSTSQLIYSNKDGKQVDFVVSLSAEASPYMNQIMNDSVYLSVDWNRSAADENATKRVYIPDNGWSTMYVYSWKDDGSQNAAWPGVALERDPESNMFVANLLAHDHFIFTENAEAVEHRYPLDGQGGMSKASLNYDVLADIYFDWTEHTFTDVEPVIYEAPYYLVGDPTAWGYVQANGFALDEAELPENADHQWKLTATVVSGDEFKINGNNNLNQWFGIAQVEDACKVPETGIVYGNDNFVFRTSGTYDIYLKQLKNDAGFSIYIALHA